MLSPRAAKSLAVLPFLTANARAAAGAAQTRQSAPWQGSYLASGQFGRFILVMPAIDTVIVHRRAVTGPDFLKLADMVVAAKA